MKYEEERQKREMQSFFARKLSAVLYFTVKYKLLRGKCYHYASIFPTEVMIPTFRTE